MSVLKTYGPMVVVMLVLLALDKRGAFGFLTPAVPATPAK